MAKSKKLQKVTDLGTLDTKSEVNRFLEENPKQYRNVLTYLQKRLDNSYSQGLGQEDVLMELVYECLKREKDEDYVRSLRNATYENHHGAIIRAVHNAILEDGAFPSTQYIAQETGLSRTTVYRHIKDGLKSEYNSFVKGKLEYMGTLALEHLYKIGMEDRNVSALKSYIELSGAISKRPASNVNNYIQINNLKLSKEEFDQLPNDTIREIEKLITEKLTD